MAALSWLLNLGFAGSESGVVVTEESTTTGGGKKRKRTKYPRRVMLGGFLYWVNSPEEERQLLAAMAERAREQAKIAEALGDKELGTTIRKRAIRVEKRIEAVDTRESDWISRLLEEDEELLVMLG